MADGAAIMLGGKTGSKDQFVEPTVLSNATVSMQLANEETFGPVAPLFPEQDNAIREPNR
jgi:succinate-semialdehyde dehydrogenase/glutarate-semialdehyde dehydrogenase